MTEPNESNKAEQDGKEGLEQKVAELERQVAEKDAYIAAFKAELMEQIGEKMDYSASLRLLQSQAQESSQDGAQN